MEPSQRARENGVEPTSFMANLMTGTEVRYD